MARKPIVVKHPGALHRMMGIKQGKKISSAKIHAAAKKGGAIGRDARFAINVLNHK
jgi:Cdc6-like AAA superfamily ATPase